MDPTDSDCIRTGDNLNRILWLDILNSLANLWELEQQLKLDCFVILVCITLCYSCAVT